MFRRDRAFSRGLRLIVLQAVVDGILMSAAGWWTELLQAHHLQLLSTARTKAIRMVAGILNTGLDKFHDEFGQRGVQQQAADEAAKEASMLDAFLEVAAVSKGAGRLYTGNGPGREASLLDQPAEPGGFCKADLLQGVAASPLSTARGEKPRHWIISLSLVIFARQMYQRGLTASLLATARGEKPRYWNPPLSLAVFARRILYRRWCWK